MARNIYKLKFHETIQEKHYRITRVPGGWVYEFVVGDNKFVPVFVPFSDEFENAQGYRD